MSGQSRRVQAESCALRRRRWAITPAIPVKPSKVIVAGSGTAVMPDWNVKVELAAAAVALAVILMAKLETAELPIAALVNV